LYQTLKLVHLLGIVLLLGNVTITAFWKVFADRNGDAGIVRFAQRMVTITDWVFTLGGIVLISVGGYGMLWLTSTHPFGADWLIVGQGLFALSGIMWLAILVPVQMRQGRDALAFEHGAALPPAYRRDARTWILWGVIATLPLLAAVCVMILKPEMF
jgi:uncharacterized membrane protein